MKFHYLFIVSLFSLTMLSACKTSTYNDELHDAGVLTNYQATSRSVYPSPQAYDINHPSYTKTTVIRHSSSSSELEVPYDEGRNAVKSSFGSAEVPPQ